MGFSKQIHPFVSQELQAAKVADGAGRPEVSFRHLERAHVLGQASTVEHVRAHLHMLMWALRHRRAKELLGQVMRTVGAATKTVFWIPVGNTGGANVSPFKPMPIPSDLARVIEHAKATQDSASR
jgi:hypothetical protein